jgi:uncharacterized membrane-anchored protein YjiN (DUF445 family)/ribosome-associated protein YbcJ (S4-like RNA binding protein)
MTISQLSAIATQAEVADQARRRRLRRMRTVATGLLVVAGVVYLCTLHRTGLLGYVNAGAEASMVGAIADWFAVTALFRHPLGVPIPHTALIPRRKDDFGGSLQDFFTENFLHEQVIRERLAAADIVGRVARWLEVEDNARRAVREGATALSTGLTRLKSEDVQAVVVDVLIPRLVNEPISPVAGPFLEEVIADKAHHGLVDLVIDEGLRWLINNPETFIDVLTDRAPWWAPDRLNELVTHRLHLEAVRWLEDIKSDPHHHARYALDSLLAQLAQDLMHDPSTQARAEALKVRVLEQPQMVATGMSIWTALRTAFLAALDEEDGPLRARAVGEVRRFATRLHSDDVLRLRFDTVLARSAIWVMRFRPKRGASEPPIDDVPIKEDAIRLGQFLKLANLVESGAEAKVVIAEGHVLVDGETELRRGRQLAPGAVVEHAGRRARVTQGDGDSDVPW